MYLARLLIYLFAQVGKFIPLIFDDIIHFIEYLSRLYYKIYYNVFKTIIIQMQPHVYMCCIVEQYPSFKNKNKIQYLLHVKTSKC